jgi:hypothetical protein
VLLRVPLFLEWGEFEAVPCNSVLAPSFAVFVFCMKLLFVETIIA